MRSEKRKNGRVYIITNLLERPATGWDPRTTLQIVEMHPDSLQLIRDTVTVIEPRGIEDYEMLYLLDSLVKAHPGADPATLARAREVCKIRPSVSGNLRESDRTGEAMEVERRLVAHLIETLEKE